MESIFDWPPAYGTETPDRRYYAPESIEDELDDEYDGAADDPGGDEPSDADLEAEFEPLMGDA